RAFLGVNDEHAHAGLACGHLLHEGLWRVRVLARGDAGSTFDPRPGRALDVVEHFAAAPSIAADDVAVAAAAQIIEVLARHHAAVTDEHHALEPEALLEVAQHIGNGVGVASIAGEDMMRDRPAVDHDQTDQDLPIARLAVAAVAVRPERRAAAVY